MKESFNIIQSEEESSEVLKEIGGILTEVSLMGANDSELPELFKLMRDVQSKSIEPKEALERTYQIKNSKQDYH